MDCVNHSGVSSTAFCQNCGKALCASCVRHGTAGQILCEPCWTTWQSFQQPFVPSHPSGPNPAAAAVLGLIPGVGAMYNGQFFKGLTHVVVFAVLVSVAHRHGIFGIFIGAWILYQSFEAFHTAKAMRDGQPTPDPLGLNEVGNWLNLGVRPPSQGQAGGPLGTGPANNPGQSGPAGQTQAAGGYQSSYGAPYGGQYQTPWQRAPFTPPAAGFVDPAGQAGQPGQPIPPAPPVPPFYWRRKEPVGAVVLIALGLLFLLGQLDFFSGRFFEYAWPLLLIALGVWLIVRRLGGTHGGC